MAASEIGVSITRSRPELFTDPFYLCEVAATNEEVRAQHEDRLVPLHLLPHTLLEGLPDCH